MNPDILDRFGNTDRLIGNLDIDPVADDDFPLDAYDVDIDLDSEADDMYDDMDYIV